MPVKKVRVMRTNDDKSKEQVYPFTHVDAVDGLESVVKNGKLQVGVKTINGASGDVIIPVLSEELLARIMTMLEAYENGEIGGGTTPPGNENITAEKVGEL